MAEGEDKSLPATARRLQQARAAGNVPLSRDAASFAALAAGLATLLGTAPAAMERLASGLRAFFYAAGQADLPPGEALHHAAVLVLETAAPAVAATLGAGLAATWLQTGFLFHLGAISFDLARLSPMRGIKRIFSFGHVLEVGKSVLKVTVLGFAVYKLLQSEIPFFSRTMGWNWVQLLQHLLADCSRVVFSIVLAQGAIVGLDLFLVRFKFARDMRMSREDVKQERKDIDGDPHIKGKRRRIRMVRARRRMMAAVQKATVVITNPTHYAVALSYERGKQAAPRVVAKGMDEVAAHIREIAEQHRVPLVRNPPLARALHLVELDAEIPAEHFQAVAEIIAYVWRLKTAVRQRGL